MAVTRQYITVTKGDNTPITNAPDFTQEELHGQKRDTRNKIADVHKLDQSIPRALQAIRNWTRLVYPEMQDGVEVYVTSTGRTPTFNGLLGGSSAKAGAHVLLIAADFTFVGTNAQGCIKKFNTDIRDRGPLYQQLRAIGINGIGLYGPASKFGSNFVHLDARDIDTPHLPRSTPDSQNGSWSHWRDGSPLFDDEVTEVDLQQPAKENQPPPDVCVHEWVMDWGLSTGAEQYALDLIDNATSGLDTELNVETLLNFEHRSSTNRKRLYDALSFDDKVKYSGNEDGSYNSARDYPVEVGAVVYVDCQWIVSTRKKGDDNSPTQDRSRSVDQVDIAATLTSGETNMPIPYPPLYAGVSQDPSFQRTQSKDQVNADDIRPQISAYVWSRTRFLEGFSPIVDITLDIKTSTVNTDMSSGANFIIELAPVIGKRTELGWEQVGVIESSRFKTSQSSVMRFDREGIQRNYELFYEMIFQQNDAVFLRFERLGIESESKEYVLSDKWYEVMGLIDKVSVSKSGGAIVAIKIQGRCFQKALNDESGYVNPYSVGNVSSFFGSQANNVSPRSFDGGIYQYRTIEKLSILSTMEFALLALVSNEYVPSECFENNWIHDDRNHLILTYSVNSNDEAVTFREAPNGKVTQVAGGDGESLEDVPIGFGIRGIWQKVKLWIDPRVSQYVVYDDSISTPEGSIWDHLNKICQRPYVELFTETIGDWFYIIARQPPFTRMHYFDLMKNIVSSIRRDDDKFGNFAYEINDTNQGRSSFKQWKDEYRRVFSDVVDNEGDTVRRGPVIDNTNITVTTESTPIEPSLLTIKAKEIESISLDFSDESYAWYEVDTRGMYSNTGGPYGMPIPAVYFSELADIFGPTRMSVSSNYIDLHTLRGGKGEQDNQQLLEREIAQLLGYLIETHIYLPFTRKGQITIKGGDRRIKKGTFVYNEATREIFYVNAVTNQIAFGEKSVHRTTTLQVERGMVDDFILGKEMNVINRDGDLERQKISYFNIVDTPRIQQQAQDAVDSLGNLDIYDHKKEALLNTSVLDFFLKRKQFE